MSATPPLAQKPIRKRPVTPTVSAQYWENIAIAFRTAGAALIGNSALIYYGFLGAHAERIWIAIVFGVVFVGLGCVPVTHWERNRVADKFGE